MNLKFETIVKILRKIMQLNAVIILKSINEYNRKIITKSGRKMDLYPALCILLYYMLRSHQKYFAPDLLEAMGAAPNFCSSIGWSGTKYL